MADREPVVKYAVQDGIATLTINRPDRRNALSSAVVQALIEHLRTIADASEVRVVVITGAGERAFCAGGDLAGGMAGGSKGLPGQIADKGQFAELVLALRKLGKPTVARLAGGAYGGGVGLFLACDMAIAADDVRVGLPEIKVGLWPMMVTALLVRHVGHKAALEMMMLGEKIPSAQAKEMGLLNRVVPRGELDATVAEVAGTLAARSPSILRLGRDAFYQTADMAFEPALYALRDRLVLNAFHEDAAEGVMAFIQKRPPQWKGR